MIETAVYPHVSVDTDPFAPDLVRLEWRREGSETRTVFLGIVPETLALTLMRFTRKDQEVQVEDCVTQPSSQDLRLALAWLEEL